MLIIYTIIGRERGKKKEGLRSCSASGTTFQAVPTQSGPEPAITGSTHRNCTDCIAIRGTTVTTTSIMSIAY